MLVNPLMISLNSWTQKDFQSSCPVCKKEVTMNNECCYECQLNHRPRLASDKFTNEELEKNIKYYLDKKFEMTFK